MLQNVKEGAAFHRFVQRSPIRNTLDSMVRKKLHRVVPEAGYRGLHDKSAVHTPQVILPSRYLALSPPSPNSHAQLKRASISSLLLSRRAPAPPTAPLSAMFVSSFRKFYQIARNRGQSVGTFYWGNFRIARDPTTIADCTVPKSPANTSRLMRSDLENRYICI